MEIPIQVSRKSKSGSLRSQVNVSLPRMTCGGCVKDVKEYLTSKSSVEEINVDLKNQTASFSIPGSTKLDEFMTLARQENKFFKNAEVSSFTQ